MCFSAPVSFAASGIVGAIGIATLAQVKEKKEIPFALIPLIFALHQFMEGITWLYVGQGGTLHAITTYLFLIIAVSLWPFYTPWSVYMLETKKNKIRKKILRIMTIAGGIAALSTLTAMLYYKISIDIVCNSISYNIGASTAYSETSIFQQILHMLYATGTIGSLWIIKNKIINFFGITVFISFIITYIFQYQVYFSVWCFFSAILSIIIFFYFKQRRKLDPK